MKVTNYNFFVGDKTADDPERAVLPTIIYAKRSNGPATSRVLALGWWAWGFGIIRTTIEIDKEVSEATESQNV